jgi:class 3 adenylate cyclase
MILTGMNLHLYILRSIVLFFLFFYLTCPSVAQQDPFTKSSNLWNEYKKTNIDSIKIRLLANLASISTNFLGDDKLADSISDIAVQIAEKNNSSLLKVIAYNNYIESVDLKQNFRKTIGYARKALKLCKAPEMAAQEWRTVHNLVAIYLSTSNADTANIQANKAMELAEKLNNKGFLIESYLATGRSQEGKFNMMDALNNYLLAQKLSEEINDKNLLKKCFAQLSDFYNRIKTFDKAIEYKQKQQVILLAYTHPVDSVELMWTKNEKDVIISRYNNLIEGKNLEQLIDYAIRTKNIRLKNFEFALYRTHLISANNIDELYRVYNQKYPAEFRLLSVNDIGLYYRLKAFFKEEQHQSDSAYYYFTLAEEKIRTNPNLLFRSNFYIRFGQFLTHVGRTEDAINNFTKAYQLAEADPLFGQLEFMLTASLQLSDLYALMGNFPLAYYYSEKNGWLRNTISTVSNKEKVNRMWLEYQIKLDNEKRDIQLRQRKNERNMLIAGIAFLFIVTLLIFRNYRNQKRSNKLLDAARKKSEDLLLNILPFETAEELKLYGKAKAKRFDEVTVMFTDFKDFTQASEKLSAEELVDKIHFYFSEFDRIIEKYGIEKIKIIGDSYMCVGGLPVSNATHAHDVINAALELQELMIEQKAQRSERGQTFFELRIGIHSGPVIAGIVGIKKFAYDIWGDTVNTASRMENCGEINKVNISGNTYEKIKEKFVCTYRGKVKAKNKGEIDMYFVESPKV